MNFHRWHPKVTKNAFANRFLPDRESTPCANYDLWRILERIKGTDQRVIHYHLNNNSININIMSSADQDLDKLRRETVDMATRTSKDSTLNDLTSEARTVASDTQAFLANLGEKVLFSEYYTYIIFLFFFSYLISIFCLYFKNIHSQNLSGC